jgi:N-acetylmuramic acid 6-phosphate etherase
MPRVADLPTERLHPGSRELDRLPTLDLLRLMNREDARVVRAVRRQLPRIAEAARGIAQALTQGGRLILVGAGTSGRLGVLEAAECPPTFHTSPSTVQAIIAGGPRAVFRSREGAEDDRRAARAAIRRRVRRQDAVVGISASGVTPFVDAALREADRVGARTWLITCHPRSPIPARARIVVDAGPELLAGSTRLKAGTATKVVLNMLTLSAMARCGKTHGNLMADVRPTSQKLRARALRVIRILARCDEAGAARALTAARGRTKVAVVMAATGCSYRTASRRLAAANGSLRTALQDLTSNGR